jgi:hypothetical protein
VARPTLCRVKQRAAAYAIFKQETQDLMAESNRGIAPRSLAVLFDELEKNSLDNPGLQYRIR